MRADRIGGLAAIVFFSGMGGRALAAEGAKAPVCERPAAGSAATPAPSLHSQKGVLTAYLDYVSSTDADGRALYCFVTREGLESPTLRVKPGDTLVIFLTNRLPRPAAGADAAMGMSVGSEVCGDPTMNAASVNMHFHGTNTSPTCHSDEVIHTVVNPGQTFRYEVKFPPSEPPGLYWYHPHIHGLAQPAVQGGASGAIVVEGLERLQPDVAGLPERVLMIRDQTVAGEQQSAPEAPSWDLTLNYVPISYPTLVPAVLRVRPGRRELWRVVNGSADAITDLDLKFDGVDQPLEVVGLDGVPTGSQDGTGRGRPIWMKHILIPTGGRAEFIVTTPQASVKRAAFETRAIDTGPDGDSDTARALALLTVTGKGPDAAADLPSMPPARPAPSAQLFGGLESVPVTASRTLYFSSFSKAPRGRLHHDHATKFFITVDGQRPKLFRTDNPPAIVTTQGAVEAWTVENRTGEVHEFHMHQIHFKLMKENGVALRPSRQQYLDTVQVPYWTGKGPYPSVTMLMDFRGHVTGDFVYHCHILEHEDGGMMATIRVLPRP